MISEQGALPTAARWGESLLLGGFGTMVATLAVALAGLALLSGRVSVRHGARVVIGCFILFGASVIAKGLFDIARMNGQPVVIPPAAPAIPLPAMPKAPPPNPDPYAGASVPM